MEVIMTLNNTIKRVFLCLLIISLSTFYLSGCAAQKKPMETSDEKKEKEVPKELKELRENIDELEKNLEGIHEESKKPLIMLKEEMEKGTEQDRSEDEEKSSSSSSDKATDEEIKFKHEQKIFKKLEDIKEDTLKLHTSWNNFEPVAVSDLVVQTSVTDFENSLNNLTKFVEEHNIYMSLIECNELYKSLPDFFLLYKSKTPPELDRIRYAVKKTMLVTEKSDFESLAEAITFLESIWSVTKPQLSKDNLEVMNKFEFALSDLKTAIENKNLMITKAKSEVMLKITDEIEQNEDKPSS